MCSISIKSVIQSCNELERIIKQVQHERGISGYTEIYRGQGRDCWKLVSKIARQFKDQSEIEIKERNLIHDFRNALKDAGLSRVISTGSNKGSFEADWLLIQQAQHFELPTRFMDWSGKWEVALCFAVSDELDDKFDGQFWIFMVPDKKWISNNNCWYLSVDPFNFKETVVLNSAIFHAGDLLIQIAMRRKGKQMGRFFVQPYSQVFIPLEEQAEFKPYLHKITIPAKCKRGIREDLRKFGLTKETCMKPIPFCQKDQERYQDTINKIDNIVDSLCHRYFNE